MQNFLVNPLSHVLVHLIDEHLISTGDPVRIGFSLGGHSIFLDSRVCPDLFAFSAAGILLGENGISHTVRPNGEDTSPDYVLGEGFANIRAYVPGSVTGLCDFTTFAADMIAGEENANGVFFCDYVIVQCTPSGNGLVIEDAAVRKLWEIAEKGEDGSAALVHGALLAIEDPLNGEAAFDGALDFLGAAAKTAADYCCHDAAEWFKTASAFVLPYVGEDDYDYLAD